LCREFGAGLLYTEMVSADGSIREQQKTLGLAEYTEDERPIGVQIFGSDPDTVAGAVDIIAHLEPDFIDLNFGCPAKKVVKRGAGSALMRDLPLLQAVAESAVKASSVPVTAKLRAGWDVDSINVVEAAQRLQDVGISMLAVHPRTQTQQFKGKSNWQLIGEVKQAVDIPVIGNGDIHSGEDVVRMMQETDCDGVMVGRAAMGNPWVFRRIQHFLQTAKDAEPPTEVDRLKMTLRHFELAAETFGEQRTVFMMRKVLAKYLKGFVNATELRREIFSINEYERVIEVLRHEIDLRK